MTKLHDRGLPIYAEEGEVQIAASHGATGSLTPEAAMETADKLVQCAEQAVEQRAGQPRQSRSTMESGPTGS